MKLDTEFYKLPLRFDVERLEQEISQFSQEDWIYHPPEVAGEASLILVSVGGRLDNDFAISAPVESTSFLERCPYLKQLMRSLDTPISRSRLIRLSGGADRICTNYNYHWFRRSCIYVAIVTNSAVEFCCNDKSAHMGAGETWTFDNSQHHWLVNKGEQDCIHLVIETKGSPSLNKMLAQAEQPCTPESNSAKVQVRELPYLPDDDAQICLEPYRFEVLTSQEIDNLTAAILADVENSEIPQSNIIKLVHNIKQFRNQWEKAFYRFGHNRSGELTYQDLIFGFTKQIASETNKWLPQSGKGQNAIKVIGSMLLTSNPPVKKKVTKRLLALAKKKSKAKAKFSTDACYRVVDNVELQKGFQQLVGFPKHAQILELFHSASTFSEVSHRLSPELEIKEGELGSMVQKLLEFKLLKEEFTCPEFERPICIVSAPRAGSTLLFETLCKFPDLWTIGDESHEIIEGIPELHPSTRNFSSNRLTEADALPHICSTLRERFTQQLQNREGKAYLDLPIKQRPTKVRFLEKTPKNALRIPFLKALFPGALFIYLYREPRENISSMMEGWRARRFISYQPLPGWPFREWCFLLTPGWSSLQESSIAEIAAYQWKIANSYIWEDLQTLAPSSWCLVRYSDLVREPAKTIRAISEFAGLTWDKRIEQLVSQSLPVSTMATSKPSPDKWRKNEREIAKVLPNLEPIINLVEKKHEKSSS
ncbi:MAG: hypothetical protein F6K37_32510 [Moorea sp. SIO4E2]|uniref:sulfotransferase n=1 Tax=Moorena sp. SIO4E2 TaxID=2607826 RepID=UPI0013BC5F91|nr:sulfotransferase [Moorena sp. SIO4E2]NEQ10480.1 hypothetical protein [Moorena sp. SIO4E2]